MMWVASVGMLPTSAFNHDRWKFWKKVFNLIKNYTQLFRAYLLYKINLRKLVKIEESLSDHSALLCGESNYEATELMRTYINQHSNVYDQMFVLIRSFVRIMMLNYKLKIVFWRDLFHPIFVTFMSITQNIIALFKIWLKKRYNFLSGKLVRVQDYVALLPQMEAQFSKCATPLNCASPECNQHAKHKAT